MEQDRANAASRIKTWTRGHFGDVTVLVTELESAVPGFPHLHTVVAFWNAEQKHFHFRVFKPLEQVTADEWTREKFGANIYNLIWRPMLVGKFGEENLKVVNMAWLWARLHSRRGP